MVNDKWKKVYGRNFPAGKVAEEMLAKAARAWRNTEEFIEDVYPIDVGFNIDLDCDVSQNGYRENTLGYMLSKRIPLLSNKKLLFTVTGHNVPEPFTLKWKVLNQGAEAERRDNVRGQIVADDGYMRRKESTTFKGTHVVECYAVKNGVVVAREQINVPIQ